MRTTKTSITKTCRACGTVNTLVIMTAGIPPRWRIGCSKCRHAIVGTPSPTPAELAVERAARHAAEHAPRRAAEHAPESVPENAGERSADVVPLPVLAMRHGRWLRPAGRGAALPAIPDRRQDMARRMRGIRASARASSGISLAAVCGIVLVAFVMEREPATAPVPAGLDVMAGTRLLASDSDPVGALAGQPAPVYTHPRLSAPSRPASPGVPASATAAAGDPGYASIIDLRQPMPEFYPDPREGMMALEKARLDGIALATATAADEDALALSAGTRREIQRRLRLAEHDPRSIDGVFGPMTRTAIAEWQAEAGLPATGYLDGAALAMLVDQTRAEYGAWQTAERQRREREQQVAAATVRHETKAADGCARQGSGKVAYGQSIRCDFKGLRENLAGLLERRRPDGA